MFDLPIDHTFGDIVRAAIRRPSDRLGAGYEIAVTFPQMALQLLVRGSPLGEYGALEVISFRSEEALRTPAFSVRRSLSDVFFSGLHQEIFSEARSNDNLVDVRQRGVRGDFDAEA